MTQTSENGTVLSVRDLSVDFPLQKGVLHAVRDVNLDIKRGKTLALVGESGSGKSVSARSLIQLVDSPGRIVSGKVNLFVDGTAADITAMGAKSPHIRAIRGGRIGLIFQEPMSALSPMHKIGDQIDEAIEIHLGLDKKAARKRTVELLRQVEIPNPERMADQYSFEYSGGMRQRVCIAMALACDPDILIADEPTTALDVTTQAEILDLIKRLQEQRGLAVLLITHDMGVVAEVADEVAVMQKGRIVEHGTADEIFYTPKHPYTKRLLGATLKLEHASDHKAGTYDPASEPILKIRNLSKHFGHVGGWFSRAGPSIRAVDDVSFDLHRGENLGIVGESGSGKTTLGRMIMRIIEPTSGEVIYTGSDDKDQDVLALQRKGLKKYHAAVRMIFQDPFASLNPRMTVKQIVGDPLKINNIASGRARDDRVAELLEMVGLSAEMMDRYPHAFSGGQRQRIGIARALALDPRIIIADEATSALDVSIRSQILDLLLDLQKRLDLSFIFIAHDISVVRYFCDRVLVMHKGKLVEIGEAEQVCTTPSKAYTQALISAIPNPDPRNKRMLHRTRFQSEPQAGAEA
ncbi:ABC transporter ATP-binding protein [Psychromarinibacter sp. C21-152]|uniref:ABC transporter ATP-binding protein n=1 Tax=Psychromarinibacter sediminicola TaxID=3033385 RepID=A0AAE3NQZ6_9RHOB|nr:ABC transporter ATP-binding protein [Psychromarinibacter sediminicola]MDF0600421.1 ABC transporter ATP-binding protein [Psychromarinibacter sediminicola]